MALRLLAVIAIAMTIPVSQLRTVSITSQCCCPDPSHCHCPDHSKDHSTQPSMRACHRTTHEAVAPQLPSFKPPEIAVAIAPPRTVVRAQVAMPAPHAAPALDEPYGPS